MKHLSFKRHILVWLLVAFFILCLNALAVYKSFARFGEQTAWVTHTYEVINNLENIVSELKDVQSAQRGYIITGQEDYLAPYALAIPKIKETYATLETLLKDNTKQEERLKNIKVEVDRRLNTAEKVIAAYRAEGQDVAFTMVKGGAGKLAMDEVRASVGEMVNIEKNLLSLRQKEVQDASKLTLLIGSIGLLIFIGMFGFLFWMIRRETNKRESTEVSLKRTLDDMHQISEDERQIASMLDYLQSCQSTQEAYSLITLFMPEIFHNTHGAVFIFNNSRNFLEQVVTWGEYITPEKDFVPDDCWALRRGRPHLYVPHGAEPACTHISDQDHSGAKFCFPMQAQGDSLGLFYIATDTAQAMDEYKQNMLRRVAEQISLALSNLRLQNKLKNQSIQDPLTGLFNRRYLEETMERELSRAKRTGTEMSVMILDIDHFKKYNDTMGHDSGDALLIQFANLLRKNTRKEDIVCRYGGEEFVIVLPTTSHEMALQHANKICKLTSEMKITANKKEIEAITVSIGLATYPLHGEAATDLIHKADVALYEAKHNGRNQVRVSSSLAIVDASE